MRIKTRRVAFNRMRLFYFKEKPTTPLRHGGKTIGIGMLYFMLTKIIEKKHLHKMHNTSSSSYQSICLIKVNYGDKYTSWFCHKKMYVCTSNET